MPDPTPERVAECYGTPMVPMEPPEARDMLLATQALFEHADEAHDFDRCIDLIERQRAALTRKDALLRECSEVVDKACNLLILEFGADELRDPPKDFVDEAVILLRDFCARLRAALPAEEADYAAAE